MSQLIRAIEDFNLQLIRNLFGSDAFGRRG